MSTLKVTNIRPQSGTDVHITGSLIVSDIVRAREVVTTISSSQILVSGSTVFGDTSDDTHTFTGDLSVDGNVNITGFSNVSASIATNETDIDTLQAASASFDSSINNLETDSGSFSTRITAEEANVDALQVDSGSFSTRITAEEVNVDALQVDSGSFSTRITTEEANVDALQVDSGSFSTRITTEEANIDALQVDSGSYSTRVTTNETNITALQSFSSSLDATYATDAQLNSVSASVKTFATDADTTLSSSLATDIAGNTSDIVTINATNATTGTNTFTGNQIVSSSVLVTLQPVTTTPAPAATGSLIVSGSPAQLYIYNGSGSGWNRV